MHTSRLFSLVSVPLNLELHIFTLTLTSDTLSSTCKPTFRTHSLHAAHDTCRFRV